MSELFFNRDVEIRSRGPASIMVNERTGWSIPCDQQVWELVRSFDGGRDPETIRHARVHNFAGLLEELQEHRFLLLEEGAPPTSYVDFFPKRTSFSVYYSADSHTDVAVHREGSRGEIRFDSVRLEGFEHALWALCSGDRTVAQLAHDLDDSVEQIQALLDRWTALDHQIVRLLPRPIVSYPVAPPQLLAVIPFVPAAETTAPDRAPDNVAYHEEQIQDGDRQFDRIESTLSHLLRVRHPALGERSYGEALLARLQEIRPLAAGDRILEIGGGRGDLSKEILVTIKRTMAELAGSISYTIADLSPGLIRSQTALHREAGVLARTIQCDAQQLPLPDQSVDVVISNEVISDLPTPELDMEHATAALKRHRIPGAEGLLRSLDGAPPVFRLNIGAFRVLAEVHRVLEPGGVAIVTEYGFEDALPARAEHLDHDEFTIHFGHMQHVAGALGFEAELTNIFDFLGIETGLDLITHASYEAGTLVAERNGIWVPNLLYTPEVLSKQLGEAAGRLGNLQFVRSTDSPGDRAPFEIVKVLVCLKPAG